MCRKKSYRLSLTPLWIFSYEGEETGMSDNPQFIGYSEPYIMSVIDLVTELPEDCIYPDSVKHHLLNEGRVIVLRQLHSD